MIRETIWQHAAIEIIAVCQEQYLSFGNSASRQQKSGYREHCVTAPISEPWIACDDRDSVPTLRTFALAFDNELVCRKDQLLKRCFVVPNLRSGKE